MYASPCEERPPELVTKTLVTELDHAIDDALESIVITNPRVVLLEGCRTVLRTDHDSIPSRVKIIGGGSSGMEPADASYVGPGLLTAAVVGDIFTAPPVGKILSVIRKLGRDHLEGILIIIKNNQGDRLNFSIALERARKEGIHIQMIVVAADVSDPPVKSLKRKGLAECILVYKIAGAMAEAGKSLDEIFRSCTENCLNYLYSISHTLNSSSLPFSFAGQTIRCDEMGVGTGLQCELPAEILKLTSMNECVHLLLNRLLQSAVEDDLPIVLLISNLGGNSKFEEMVFMREVVRQLFEKSIKPVRYYFGNLVTSLDSKGFCITILKLTAESVLEYLDAAAYAPAWQGLSFLSYVKTHRDAEAPLSIPLSDIVEEDDVPLKCDADPCGPDLSEEGTRILTQVSSFALAALLSCSRQLDIMDREIGDGDTGSSLRKGVVAIQENISEDHVNFKTPYIFLNSISEIIEETMGGILGGLYSVMLRAAASSFLKAEEANVEVWYRALKKGVQAVKHYGQAELGDRTMLDALIPAVQAFGTSLTNGQHPTTSIYYAAATCEYHAAETKSLSPKFGKIGQLKSKTIYPDPGAHAVTVWMRAIAEGIKLNMPEDITPTCS